MTSIVRGRGVNWEAEVGSYGEERSKSLKQETVIRNGNIQWKVELKGGSGAGNWK
jgi:hypothetical protein